MVMMYILFLFALIFIRLLAGYDSRRQKGKYIVIKNKTLCTLLLDKMAFLDKTDRRKRDRNKMSIAGLIYYLAALVVLIVSIMFAIVPDILCEPWAFESAKFYLLADTLNKKIVTVAITLLVAAVFSYLAVAIVKMTKDTKPAWLRIFIWVTACLMIFVGSFLSVYMLIDLLFGFA